MQFTATTPLACVLCLLILILGPRRGIVIVFATLPLGTAAAVNLSGLGSIFVAEAAMLSLCVSLIFAGVGTRDVMALLRPHGSGLLLLGLMIVCIFGAVFLPRLHAGQTEVFTLVRQADGANLALRPLRPTPGNISQTFRFVLAASGFATAALAMMRFGSGQIIRQAVLTASVVHILLALLDLAGPLGGVNPLALLRNAYVMILDDQTLLGVRRLIAGFPEPSAFGIYTIGLFGIWLRIWSGQPRSLLAGGMVIVLAALMIRSTSTAAYLGVVVFSALFLTSQLAGLHARRAALPFVVLASCIPFFIGATIVLFQTMPHLSAYLDTILFEKLRSTSGSERLGWNIQAVRNFSETLGMGTGIGSLRASGWPFAVLGSIGALGALLYLWFLAALLRPFGQGHHMIAALQAGCVAVLILSFTILPQPNLGLPFFLMAGLVAGAKLKNESDAPQIHRDTDHQVGAFT